MKKLLILLLSVISLTVFAQQKKVAVYVTGNDPINDIVSSRLMDGIAKSGKYRAIERTAAFLNELSKEQNYQSTGAVDDNEISRLGKQFGVDYVCVASAFDVWGNEKYISTRLIDVETAEVVVSSSSNGAISSSSQLITALNTLSEGLLSSFEQSKLSNAKKVAVYVSRTGNKDVDIILGDQLVAGFAHSGRYFAIERTQGFLNQLSKEQDYQHTGAVDDSDLTRLGKQFGVHYVCIAKTSRLFGDYFISTRLIDVETATVVNSWNKEGAQLSNAQSVITAAQEIARKLSGRTIEEEKQFQIEEAKRIERERLEREEQERLRKERQAEIARQKEAERQAEIARQREARRQELLSQGFVDLGLPSGTLWKNANEGGDNARYTYNEAVSRFGNKLPTEEQLEELKNKCTWTWIGNGYKVTGLNGNSITLPAAGCRLCNGRVYRVGAHGYYWSSTPFDSDEAWELYFALGGVFVVRGDHCFGQSVRLVQNL